MACTLFNAACAENSCQRANTYIKASGKWRSCSDFGLVVSALHNIGQKKGMNRIKQGNTLLAAVTKCGCLSPSRGHKEKPVIYF